MGWESLEATGVRLDENGRVIVLVRVHDEYFAPSDGKVVLSKKDKRKLRRLLLSPEEKNETT